MRSVRLAAVLLALPPVTSLATRLLPGDEAPVVRTHDDRFVVSFGNSRDHESYETVVTQDGKVLADHRIVHTTSWEDPSAPSVVYTTEHAYLVPHHRTSWGAYEVRDRTRSGGEQTFELHCRVETTWITDAAAANSDLLVLASSSRERQLRFDRYDPRGQLVDSLVIGSPRAWGYFFRPTASKIARYGNVYLVAWVDWNDTSDRITLSWWNPGTREAGRATLPAYMGEQGGISIGVLGNDILIAYNSRGLEVRTLHLHGLPIPDTVLDGRRQ